MAYIDPNTGEILNRKGQRLNEAGQELPDPTPIAPPVGYIKQPSLHQLIREMVVREHQRLQAQGEDYESPEEAEDFDVDDDFDPQSPWEENFDPLEGAPEALRSPSSPSPEGAPQGAPSPAPQTAPEGGTSAPTSATEKAGQ